MVIIKVKAIEWHRNGITGAGFHAVTFTFRRASDMLAIVFAERGNVAVLDVGEVTQGNIGVGNQWRGDHFERELRDAIAKWDENGGKL